MPPEWKQSPNHETPRDFPSPTVSAGSSPPASGTHCTFPVLPLHLEGWVTASKGSPSLALPFCRVETWLPADGQPGLEFRFSELLPLSGLLKVARKGRRGDFTLLCLAVYRWLRKMSLLTQFYSLFHVTASVQNPVLGCLRFEQIWSPPPSCACKWHFKPFLPLSQICLTSAFPRIEFPKGDCHTALAVQSQDG